MNLQIKGFTTEQYANFFGFLVKALFRVNSWFYRCSVVNYPKTNCIFALWHSRQCGLYGLLERHKTYCLISKSRDGEVIAMAAESLGMKTVRGSAGKRGAAQASLEILNVLKNGGNAAITIDGPRGPKEVVKKGIVELAKLSGAPIVPFAWYNPSKFFLKFKTWDSFRFPFLCTNHVLLCGDPIYVSKEADDDEIERVRKEVEDKLKALQKDLKANFKKYYKLGQKKQIK